jgi:hypothetical protein
LSRHSEYKGRNSSATRIPSVRARKKANVGKQIRMNMSLDPGNQTDTMKNMKNSKNNHKILNSSEDEMPDESGPYGILNIVKEKPIIDIKKSIARYCV